MNGSSKWSRAVSRSKSKGSWRRGDHLPETLVFLKLKKNAREFAIFLPFPLFSFFFSPSSLNSTDISSLLFIEKKYDSNLYDSEGNTPTYKARFLGFARYSKKSCNYSDSVARIGTYVSASRCSTLLECSTPSSISTVRDRGGKYFSSAIFLPARQGPLTHKSGRHFASLLFFFLFRLARGDTRNGLCRVRTPPTTVHSFLPP